MRQLLKNAKVYDGTGAAPYQADILLEEDRIAMIAPLIIPGGKDGQAEQSV